MSANSTPIDTRIGQLNDEKLSTVCCLPTRSIYIVTLQYCSRVGQIDFVIDFRSKVLECDSTSTKREPGREWALSPQIDIGDTLSYYLNLPFSPFVQALALEFN